MPELMGAAGILIHHPTRRVLLQHRTDDAPVNPGRWGMFGGSAEPEDGGDPVATMHRELTMRRELHEELGIDVNVPDLVPLWSYITESGTHRNVYLCSWPALTVDFALGEGQGYDWFAIDEALSTLDLTTSSRRDLVSLDAYLAERAGQATPSTP